MVYQVTLPPHSAGTCIIYFGIFCLKKTFHHRSNRGHFHVSIASQFGDFLTYEGRLGDCCGLDVGNGNMDSKMRYLGLQSGGFRGSVKGYRYWPGVCIFL